MLRWEAAFGWKPLRVEQLTLIAQEKSAEGIVPVITRLDNNFIFPEVHV